MAPLHAGTHLLLGLLPVLAFLGALILLDGYKLVRLSSVLRLLVAGGVAAGIGLLANGLLIDLFDFERQTLVRYVAPVVEELLKAAAVVWVIWRRRVGFLVDAAILGFAVGAGFAAVENVHYFFALDDPTLLLWVVRGFGTAVMHGSVTAIMAIVSKQFADSRGGARAWVYLPGWLLAVLLHSVFNHFPVSPNAMTVLLLVVLPVFFVAVFHFSEIRTRDWLGVGFDSDQELLELIHSGQISSSRIGAYFEELKGRFSPTTVVDMLCLLRLRLELSIKAKGILMMRQAGFAPEPDPEIDTHFGELRYLERTIGRIGMLAMAPFFHFSDRDLWQYHMLGRG
jgi:RsiW-degrading membrane proteinase PrsW (M82 family)